MARISDLRNHMGDGWEITIKGKPQEELIEIKEFVNHLETKENTWKELEKINKDDRPTVANARRKAMNLPLIKPQGILIVIKGDSMLDVARKVVEAVEFSVESPTGLSLISFDKERETKDRVKELIEYLKVYTNWR